jgi:hypothetical protein
VKSEVACRTEQQTTSTTTRPKVIPDDASIATDRIEARLIGRTFVCNSTRHAAQLAARGAHLGYSPARVGVLVRVRRRDAVPLARDLVGAGSIVWLADGMRLVSARSAR